MSLTPSLTPIIVTYNNSATISACLRSLAAQGLPNPIIIDNASTDDTLRQLQSLPVTTNTTNIGFAAAANQGAARATTDYLIFFNPDAELVTSLQAALEYINSHPHVAAAGLGLNSTPGHLEPYSFGSTTVTPLSLLTRKLKTPATAVASLPPVLSVAWLSAGAVLIRRSAFRALGGFDSAFFLYWEDVDLCRRLRQAGHELVLLPHITVRHQRGHSLTDSQHKAHLYDLAADRYFQKHYPAYIWWPLQLLRRCYRYFFPSSH